MTDANDDSLQELVELFTVGSPHAAALGMTGGVLRPDYASAQVPYQDHLVGDPVSGVLHGGVGSVLIDHVSGMAAFAALGAKASPVTLDLRIDYLRAPRPGGALIAEARPRKVGHVFAFISAIAHDGDPEDPVAIAQSTFMIPRSRAYEDRRGAAT